MALVCLSNLRFLKFSVKTASIIFCGHPEHKKYVIHNCCKFIAYEFFDRDDKKQSLLKRSRIIFKADLFYILYVHIYVIMYFKAFEWRLSRRSLVLHRREMAFQQTVVESLTFKCRLNSNCYITNLQSSNELLL